MDEKMHRRRKGSSVKVAYKSVYVGASDGLKQYFIGVYPVRFTDDDARAIDIAREKWPNRDWDFYVMKLPEEQPGDLHGMRWTGD